MATTPSAFVDRIRQPEYTGPNRCLPCTLLNVVIAGGVAAGVALVTRPLAGVVAFGILLGTIYLRGYLVPGTPELTKRYLPDQVLRLFGKAPELPPPGETIDVEAYLREAGALVPGEQEDLTLSPAFRDDWNEAIRDANVAPAATAGEVLDLPEPGIEERGDACVVTDDGMRAADWPSRAALLADLGGVRALQARDDEWSHRSHSEQGRILAGLRVFLESCPSCGAEPILGEETVESCCRQAEVYTYRCPDCGARLLEIEQ